MIPAENTGDTRELKLQQAAAQRMAAAAERAGQYEAARDWELRGIELWLEIERREESVDLAEAA